MPKNEILLNYLNASSEATLKDDETNLLVFEKDILLLAYHIFIKDINISK